MGSAIQLRSAVALLGRFPALASVDLDVDLGEIVLVEGPNGAGKTTLLRMCAGLVPIRAGSGSVLGEDLTRRARPRGVGFLGHASGLYEDLSALENVEFRARVSSRSPAGAAAALERLGLDGRLRDVPVVKLSAGQRRRVAIAALLMVDPQLWLLDEPHAGLDAQARADLDSVLAEASARGAAVLFASHELDRVEQLVTRTVHIERGRIAPSPPVRAAGDAASQSESAHVA